MGDISLTKFYKYLCIIYEPPIIFIANRTMDFSACFSFRAGHWLDSYSNLTDISHELSQFYGGNNWDDPCESINVHILVVKKVLWLLWQDYWVFTLSRASIKVRTFRTLTSSWNMQKSHNAQTIFKLVLYNKQKFFKFGQINLSPQFDMLINKLL